MGRLLWLLGEGICELSEWSLLFSGRERRCVFGIGDMCFFFSLLLILDVNLAESFLDSFFQFPFFYSLYYESVVWFVGLGRV